MKRGVQHSLGIKTPSVSFNPHHEPQESVRKTGGSRGHTAALFKFFIGKNCNNQLTNDSSHASLKQHDWQKTFCILLPVDLIYPLVVTEEFALTLTQSVKLNMRFTLINRWPFLLGKMSDSQEQRQTGLPCQPAFGIGNQFTRLISYKDPLLSPSSQCCLWLLARLCCDGRGQDPFQVRQACARVREGCVPRTRSLTKGHASASVYKCLLLWTIKRSVSVTVDLGTKGLRVGQRSRSVRGRRWQKGQEDPRGYGPGRVGPRGQRAPQGLEAAQAPPRLAAFLPQISPAPGRDRGNQRLEKTQWFILISTCDILI